MDRLTASGGVTNSAIDPAIFAESELVGGEMLVHIYQEDVQNDPLESADCISVEIWQREGSQHGSEKLISYNPQWPTFYENRFIAS